MERTVNMLEAKSALSRLVEAVESGAETAIVIARNGRPVARIVPLAAPTKGKRIGVAKGKFKSPVPDKERERDVAAFHFGKR